MPMSKKKELKAKKKTSRGNFLSSFKNEFWNRFPIIRFGAYFIGLIILFYLWWTGVKIDGPILGNIVKFTTKASSFVLNIFGYDTSVDGSLLFSNQYSVDLKAGCDGVEPLALFLFSIVAYPIAFKFKWPAILIAVPAFFLMNIIRVITLFLIGIYIPNYFELFHTGIWQGLFLIYGAVLWIIWFNWTFRKETEKS